MIAQLRQSVSYIQSHLGSERYEYALVLGSGLGDLADEIEDKTVIDYHEIPNFPHSTAPGHKGCLVAGTLENKRVIAMQGRFHFYEGWSMDQVVYPIRTFKLLGIDKLILTNAAGCVNESWKPGTLMLITDHIKLIAECPNRGENIEELGPRFFDMSETYSLEGREKVKEAAKAVSLDLKEGIYMMFSGPNFETPAEVRFARLAGADAVGMSTVPEAIAAAHMNLKTIGISCMTNMAAGIFRQKLNHEEVLETSARVKDSFQALIKETIRRW